MDMEIEQNDGWDVSGDWSSTAQATFPSTKKKTAQKAGTKKLDTYDRMEIMFAKSAKQVDAEILKGDEISPIDINRSIVVLRSRRSTEDRNSGFKNYIYSGSIRSISYPVANSWFAEINLSDDSELRITKNCHFFFIPESNDLTKFAHLLQDDS